MSGFPLSIRLEDHPDLFVQIWLKRGGNENILQSLKIR